eukprot:TRINITY_DN31972_c0_g1_i2.p2 TRINITY_DN31972_c0_g1~~TRINITY_DN31972_c0_g1_i2.p2  ORF type:complete len:239 (-),score=47.42 TRINITY_DN31972_c0_g1_i2:150-866(-)
MQKENDQVVINKVPALIQSQSKASDLSLYKYVLDHTRELEILARVRIETRQKYISGAYRMQVTPEQGQFLAMMVKSIGATKIIEVGVFSGYSSIAMASALPENGLLVAIDINSEFMGVAKNFWHQAGLESKIRKELGEAKIILNRILSEEGEGSYDFAFIDADKTGYADYYEKLIKLLKTGGLIIVDNILWGGKVADPDINDEETVAIREFLDQVYKDDRIDLSVVPIGDGIAICRKK